MDVHFVCDMDKILINIETLLALIKERPVIWDKTLEIYKSKPLRETAWQEICQMLNGDYEEMDENQRQQFGKLVLKKWTQMRDSWSKDFKRRKRQKKSGCLVTKRPYRYYKQLSFLKKVIDTGHDSEESSDEEDTDNESEEDNILLKIHSQSKRKTEVTEQRNDTSAGDRDANTLEETRDTKNEEMVLKRKKIVVFDKMIKLLDDANDRKRQKSEENQHLHFFKSLLPITSTLNPDETLQFQGGVIKLLQDIKRQRNL
ncbi:hypothetical protein ABMA27_011233 [Loxostege sticticalis]|uniref:MADF domain-containing protein n=1 Tax=Loxostege sticticalis TaxID=481309 RepID=A0ABR3H1S3_LOXSC